MRTVLIGTDSVYDSSGNLRPIEINTNIGWSNFNKIESDDQVFDFTDLNAFISQNNLSKVIYIGSNGQIHQAFENLFSGSSITYTQVPVNSNSVTIPVVNDDDSTLIIRTAFDITAIIDETYCANKVNFLNLIKSQSFGAQFAYRDSSGNIVSNITNIPDNGNHPNFILKAIAPSYDKTVLPKLYKVSSQDDLNTVLSNIDSTTFLMEYYINTNNLVQNHLAVYRTLNLLYPPDLTSISLGGYTVITNQNLSDSSFDSTSFQVSNLDRNKYITNDDYINSPKLLDTDEVEMADGTFKTPDQLFVGDLVKTIAIPNPNNIDIENEAADYQIDYNSFLSGTTFTTNTITNIAKVNQQSSIATVTFTDGSTWQDLSNSTYLTLSNGDVKFKFLFNAAPEFTAQVGDQIILIDTTNNNLTSVLKTIQSIDISSTMFNGWTITINPNHVFLTRDQNNQSYAAVEHNAGCTSSCGTCAACSGAGGCAKGTYCVHNGGANNLHPCASTSPCACNASCTTGSV